MVLRSKRASSMQHQFIASTLANNKIERDIGCAAAPHFGRYAATCVAA